jgi:riboflavin kinase/FMN adenylyltransferase
VRIWNGIEAWPHRAQPVTLTIGNYDGVHLGHQEILRRLVADAARRDERAVLLTFEPHPACVVNPDRRPSLLQTRGQKIERLQQERLSDLLILTFNARLAALSGEAFFEHLRAHGLVPSAVHVGTNFRFGHRREGDIELLRRVGQRHGFAVHGVEQVRLGQQVVSSSAIRARLAAGDVELVCRMLGRPFAVAGEIVRGDGRGRRLGWPTANLEARNEALPAHGVYVTETLVRAARFPSVTNVGLRPTFGGPNGPVVETHLLDFDGRLYDEQAVVLFLAHLRPERRFADGNELADQIARDLAAAEAFFRDRPLGAP